MIKKPRDMSPLFVITGFVFFWRGLWNLLDHYFFPELPFSGNLLSLLVGVCLMAKFGFKTQN